MYANARTLNGLPLATPLRIHASCGKCLKKNIVERRESETSLMPENVGELLSQEDFNHLMAFLLSKAGGKQAK